VTFNDDKMIMRPIIERVIMIIAINKPAGPTSYDVVRIIRQITHERRVGHAGTLDPLASGVLVVGIGKGTKQLQQYQEMDKEYQTTVLLGVTSKTDDEEGEKTFQEIHQPPTLTDIEQALINFKGDIQQQPPIYSAIKIHGKPAYRYARQGRSVHLGPRSVTINNIEIMKYKWPKLNLLVQCNSGVYIRSLARDIGEKLKTGGYMASLVRTRVGIFTIDKALTLEKFSLVYTHNSG
jgi:tRNA pseudouridine55 synthase